MSSRPRKRSGSVDRPTGIGPAAPAGLFPGRARIGAGRRRLGAALALASHVEVLGLDAATGAATGSGATINKEATDVVIQNSHLEATWTDENGERSEPGGVWTLATLEIDSIKGRARLDAPAAPAAGKSGPFWLDHLPGSKGRIYAT